jgi:exodeoxyribonuclease VII large subunit
VAGEVQRVRPNRNGHLYFELVEKGSADDVIGKLEAVIWRRDHERIRKALDEAGQEIVEGREMRCRAAVDFYAPFGRLQLVVREVDVVFALGQLAARRRETLLALTRAGLLERNRQLALSEHPLNLALVTALDSAAYHDFLETLRESGYGFCVVVIDASMQGRAAEGAIASALAAAARLPIDACVLIRGGGSKADLAAFDSRQVAEAVARSAVPVLTGLGHQIDESIADRVAHAAFKTPTKVAEFLVERVARAENRGAEMARGIGAAVDRRLAAARERLRTADSRVLVAHQRLARAGAAVEELGRFLARTARRLPTAAARRLHRLGSDLGRRAPRAVAGRRELARRLAAGLQRSAESRLKTARATLDGRQRLAHELGPERALARGFSITRDEHGKAVRRAEEIRYGQVLTTQLAQGSVKSRVETG